MDAALWAVCSNLGLKTEVYPIYSPKDRDFDYEEPITDIDQFNEADINDLIRTAVSRNINGPNKDNLSEFAKAFVAFIKNIDPAQCLFGEDCCKIKLDPDGEISWLGEKFEPVKHYWGFGNMEDSIGRRLADQTVLAKYRGIYWLNKPSHREVNMAYTTVL